VRAFSLAEMLLTLTLLALALVLSISNLRIDPASGDARALAMELKSLFTQARAQAIARGRPVALAFPHGGGAQPVTQSCLLLEGRARGQAKREWSFKGDFPELGIFVGQWAPASGDSFAPSPSPPDSESSRFAWADWLPPELSNYAVYAYLPSGHLVSNGQGALAGEYPLVVSKQFGYSGVPPVLTATGDCHTVLVSTRSSVRTQKGIPDSTLSSGGLGSESWGLTSPTLPVEPNEEAPIITAVRILPVTVDDDYKQTENIHALVQAGNLLTFEILARDPDGDPLTCRLSSDGGPFTHTESLPMLYVPETGEWRSIWQWRAPPAAAVDQIFQIQVTVRDQTSVATAAADVEVLPRVLVVPDGLLIFTSSGATNSTLYSCRFDGTELKALYTPFGAGSSSSRLGSPSLSQDGTRVAVGTDRDNAGLKVFSAEAGVNASQLFNAIPAPPGQSVNNPVFDATGALVYCWLTPEEKVYQAGLDGGLTELPDIPGPVAGVSQNNTNILFTEGADAKLCANLEPYDAIATFDGYFGVCILEDDLFLGQGDPDTGFALSKCPVNGPYDAPLPVADLPGGSTVGGNGRFAFYPVNGAEPAIWQIDLETGHHRRLVTNENGFFGTIANFHELKASK
jgi:hypothetical protein